MTRRIQQAPSVELLFLEPWAIQLPMSAPAVIPAQRSRRLIPMRTRPAPVWRDRPLPEERHTEAPHPAAA